MSKTRDLVDKKVVCEDLVVGKVKTLIFDPSDWKITHLEVELSKEAAELILGIKKAGIRNLLSLSAIGDIDKTINLKVKKGQLPIYLRASTLKS